MSNTTTMRRGPRYRTQHSPVRWSNSVSLRDSAATVVRQVFPAGTDYGVSKHALSRARTDGGALAQVGEWMQAASPEGRRVILAWLNGIERAERREADSVREALEAYSDADLEEERIERTVWEHMTPDTLREHMAVVRKEVAAGQRYLTAGERWLMEVGE